MDTKMIGSFLKELRKENNMTQEQLGERIGVTNKTVSRWETELYAAGGIVDLAQRYLWDQY